MKGIISKKITGNSFFAHSNKGLNAMIIVPHQDDEILTAGAMIRYLTLSGATIFVVYMTNGAWKYPANTRRREALQSLTLLGVSQKNVIFMDYPDTLYAGERSYSASSLIKDIADLLKCIDPSFIITTGFDEHPDHRMLSACVEQAVREIRKEKPAYTPVIWKRFAYPLAYTAESDFSVINNPETKRPVANKTEKYHLDFVDRYMFDWDSRIRIPLPPDCRNGDLKKNLLARALMKHRSQHIILRAPRIINSDEVYWECRTDSLTMQASVTVSSGNADVLAEPSLYIDEETDPAALPFTDHAWMPDAKDPEKKIRFTWAKPVSVKKIVLFGRISDDSAIEKLSVSLSDGTECFINRLPSDGTPAILNLARPVEMEYCDLQIIQYRGNHCGISRCAFYAASDPRPVFSPFCKITVDDNFAYEYFIGRKNAFPIGIYTYGDTGRISLSVAEGNAKFVGNKLYVDKEERRVVVVAKNADGSVYDRVVFQNPDPETSASLARIDISNKRLLKGMRICEILYESVFVLKKEGFLIFLKKAFAFCFRKIRSIL